MKQVFMNLVELEKKLIAAARLNPADDRVPYAFEKRVTALISARIADRWGFWRTGLWRAAVSCVAVAVVCGAVSFITPAVADNGNDLSQDFENTLLASVDQPDTTP